MLAKPAKIRQSEPDGESAERDARRADTIPVLEWMISGVGLALVLFSLGFLTYKLILIDGKPPAFEARFIESTSSPNGYLTKIQLDNTGGKTVASLLVNVRLKNAKQEAQRQMLIDYLPAHSSRQIKILFPSQPTADSLAITFASYTDP